MEVFPGPYPVNTEVAANRVRRVLRCPRPSNWTSSPALNGGSSDIRIPVPTGQRQGYAYSWQMNDIALVAALENDLRLESVSHAQWDIGQQLRRASSVYPTNGA